MMTTRADLRALGLPPGWAKYAGTNSFSSVSVRHDPLYPRYEAKLSDGAIAHFLLTHPRSIVSIGQHAAIDAQKLRVTYLGDYAPSAGHPAGATESRVVVLTWLMHRLPRHLGLLWYGPLWATMALIAIAALFVPGGRDDGVIPSPSSRLSERRCACGDRNPVASAGDCGVGDA